MFIKKAIFGITLSMLASYAAAGEAPKIAGTWNVTSTATSDSTCKQAKSGDVTAYVWIVSTGADGSVKVSAQGETAFPKLEGSWSSDFKILTLQGNAQGWGYEKTSVWLKLNHNKDGSLQGIRRFVSDSQSKSGRACFADFEIEAKR